MRQEAARCRDALARAAAGATVALISSGDSGVYGMAGLAIELGHKEFSGVFIEVVPGVTAASAAAARLGAPLMVDFAVISLSDLLVEWDVIRKRLEAAAGADFVTAIYNPRSQTRVRQLDEAVEIFLRHRDPSTPCGIACAVGSEDEAISITTLGELLRQDIDMRTVLIIGNSSSRLIDGRLVTLRGYEI